MKLKAIYNRPRLHCALQEALEAPLAVITAGAGYGKTTAAREYLQKCQTPSIWLTLTSADENVLWDKLCAAVRPLSAAAADALELLGVPVGAWAVSRAVNVAQAYCRQPWILCVDDYQLLGQQSPVHALVETLAFEQPGALRVLLLSRADPPISLATLETKGLCGRVGAQTLRFSPRETEGYLVMRGLRLTRWAVNKIQTASDGWISAIYLLGEGVRSGGEVQAQATMDALFTENLINPLPLIDREMLYRLSDFDSFPLDMAVEALGMERLRELLASLLRENAFISKDENGQYCFHPLLREYLQAHCPRDDAQKALCRRAGLWYSRQPESLYPLSVRLFERAGCIEEYLSLLNRVRARRMSFVEIETICRVAENRPLEECAQYPFAYLQIIFFMMLSGQSRHTAYAARLFAEMTARYAQPETQDERTILGELIVIGRVTGFGAGSQGEEPLERAARLLGARQSEILRPCDPFTFGLPMLLHSEYMRAGELSQAVERCQTNPYELVCDGFGRGSQWLIRAEAALLRCEMNDAAVLAKQAIQIAQEKRQYFVMASACTVLMRRALLAGDTQEAARWLDELRALLPPVAQGAAYFRVPTTLMREVIQLGECYFACSLRRSADIPADFLDGTHNSPMVGGLGVPQVHVARAMLLTGNPAGAECLCAQLERLPAVCQCARLEGLVLTSLSREKLYGAGSGCSALALALDEAAADDVLLPFAENPDVLPLLAKAGRSAGLNPDFLQRVRAQCEVGRAIAPAGLAAPSAALSKREREVLLLIAAGKSRAQTAALLHVQENTVKTQLASIYRKLGANGKTDAVRIAHTSGLI